MFKVVLLKPDGQYELICRPEVDLYHQITAAGHYIRSSCGGVGSCSDCVVKVVVGNEHLNPINNIEKKHLGNVFHITKERLSCQIVVQNAGEIVLDISKHHKGLDEQQRRANYMKTKVRKKEDVDKIQQEREQKREEKKEKQDSWQKHWEKEDGQRPSKKGGSRRPKTFKYEEEEEGDK